MTSERGTKKVWYFVVEKRLIWNFIWLNKHNEVSYKYNLHFPKVTFQEILSKPTTSKKGALKRCSSFTERNCSNRLIFLFSYYFLLFMLLFVVPWNKRQIKCAFDMLAQMLLLYILFQSLILFYWIYGLRIDKGTSQRSTIVVKLRSSKKNVHMAEIFIALNLGVPLVWR